MELTEEQRERIRRNRERAFAIQKQRREQQEKVEQGRKKKRTNEQLVEGPLSDDDDKNKKQKAEINTPLEDFEVGASEWCTKKEAKEMYCLPDGTLAVCEDVQERDNPHHKGWKPMKLYRRSEIREWAYKRHGGLQGLVAERNKRREKRLAKEMKEASNVFG